MDKFVLSPDIFKSALYMNVFFSHYVTKASIN